MKLAAVPSAMATVLAALLMLAPVLVGCSSTSQGATYTGAFKDGKRHGHGTYTGADGTAYTGEWKDGKLNGYGTYTDWDGHEYSGEFKDTKLVR